MESKRRFNLSPIFAALVGWLASGGVAELRQSLGRQWVQRIGVIIGILALLGLWGIDITLLGYAIIFNLTMAEFQASVIVAGGMIAADLIASFLTLYDDRKREVKS